MIEKSLSNETTWELTELASQSVADLRPVGSFAAEHGTNAPSRAKHVEGFGEAVVVNDASVDGKEAHQQDDVATGKDHVEHLQTQSSPTSSGHQGGDVQS